MDEHSQTDIYAKVSCTKTETGATKSYTEPTEAAEQVSQVMNFRRLYCGTSKSYQRASK